MKVRYSNQSYRYKEWSNPVQSGKKNLWSVGQNIKIFGPYLQIKITRGSFIYYVTTFLGFLDPLPPPPYVSMFLVLRISKNWHFLTPLPPYKCWRNIWMVPWPEIVSSIMETFEMAKNVDIWKNYILWKIFCYDLN